MHSSVAYISASVELRAVMAWRLLDHMMGPLDSMMMYPEMDLVLNRGSRSL